MRLAVKDCRFTAKEVPGKKHFEDSFFASLRRLHAFDSAFCEYMEALGRIAFLEDVLPFFVLRFSDVFTEGFQILVFEEREHGDLTEF